MELALVQTLMATPSARMLYLAPTKSLCAERHADWDRKLAPLQLRTTLLTADTDHDASTMQRSDVIVATPEKWDALTRRWSAAGPASARPRPARRLY
jgi:ATP-dependent DNA helicase HFM1/MER3